MSAGFEILVDSDALVGLSVQTDPHHKSAYRLFSSLQQGRKRIVVTSYVVDETATVISNRDGQKAARTFLETVAAMKIPMVYVTENVRKKGLAIFEQQEQRGTSVVDCINVAVMEIFEIPQIFAFDKVYHKHFGLNNIAYSKGKVA